MMKRSLGLLAFLAVGTSASAAAQAASPEVLELVEISVRENPIDRAYRDFTATGTPLVIHPAHPGDYIHFPFGYGDATVRCARLQACPIELQGGERLMDEPLAGDTERWIVATSVTGRNGEIPLVIVKPTDCNLSTNVLIPTDKRVYVLSLVSDGCRKRGSDVSEAQSIQRTRFWYPDEMREAERERDRIALATPCMADGILNQAYHLKQRGAKRGQRHPWTPEKVCDDGVRTYIQLPEGARHAEMPVLYLIGEDGEKEMLNYTPRGDVIVTDRVILRATLVVNGGGKERRVDIENRGSVSGDQGGR